jgi:hypothetical protein
MHEVRGSTLDTLLEWLKLNVEDSQTKGLK